MMRTRVGAVSGRAAYTARNLRPWRLVAPRAQVRRCQATSIITGGWAAGRAAGMVAAMVGDYRSRVRVPTAAPGTGGLADVASWLAAMAASHEARSGGYAAGPPKYW